MFREAQENLGIRRSLIQDIYIPVKDIFGSL